MTSTTRSSGIAIWIAIGKTLAPVLIRRAKSQVLTELPERLDKNFFVPMTPQQRTHHEENREAVARIVTKWRRYRFLSEADQRRLMIALLNMRMSCDSTYLRDHQTDFGSKANELVTLLAEILEQPNIKVVVFSQWLRMHELLARLGLRNPHRLTWYVDSARPREAVLLAFNIGLVSWETVMIIKKGANYGYPLREGTQSMSPTNGIRDAARRFRKAENPAVWLDM